MRRPLLLLLALTLALWVVVVPMLHGHLPGAAAHDHGTPAPVEDTTDVLGDAEVAAPATAMPLADEQAPLPLATAPGIVLVVALLLLDRILRPGGDRVRSTAAPPVARPRRGTPVARHEVIVV